MLLRAFGNIYPPFIVTPLFRNLKYKHRGSATFFSGFTAPNTRRSPAFMAFEAGGDERKKKKPKGSSVTPAESGASNQAANGGLRSGSRRPVVRPLLLLGAELIQDGRSLPSQQSQTWITLPPNPPAGGAAGAGLSRSPRPDTPRRTLGSPC